MRMLFSVVANRAGDELAALEVTGGVAGPSHHCRGRLQRFGGNRRNSSKRVADVVIADVNDDAGQDIAAHCGARAWFQHTDVADEADVDAVVQAAVDRFGGLDVMVNNAGISSKMHKSFLRADLSDFHRVMSVNVLGVMLGTRAAPGAWRSTMAAASSTSHRSAACKQVAA